jgi:hypothetical protein
MPQSVPPIVPALVMPEAAMPAPASSRVVLPPVEPPVALSSLLALPEPPQRAAGARVDPSVDVVDQIRAIMAAGLRQGADGRDSKLPEVKLFDVVDLARTQPVPSEATALMPVLQGYSHLFSNDVLAIVSPVSGLVLKLYWDTCRFANPLARPLALAQFNRLQDLLKLSPGGSKG